MITSDKIDCVVNKHNIHHWLNVRLFKGALIETALDQDNADLFHESCNFILSI